MLQEHPPPPFPGLNTHIAPLCLSIRWPGLQLPPSRQAIIQWAFGGASQQAAAAGAAGAELGAPAGMEQPTVSCIKVGVTAASAISSAHLMHALSEHTEQQAQCFVELHVVTCTDTALWARRCMRCLCAGARKAVTRSREHLT